MLPLWLRFLLEEKTIQLTAMTGFSRHNEKWKCPDFKILDRLSYKKSMDEKRKGIIV
jgi:hypothetical protein